MPKIDIRNIDFENLPEPKKEKVKKKHWVATLKKLDTLMFIKNLHIIEKERLNHQHTGWFMQRMLLKTI